MIRYVKYISISLLCKDWLWGYMEPGSSNLHGFDYKITVTHSIKTCLKTRTTEKGDFVFFQLFADDFEGAMINDSSNAD